MLCFSCISYLISIIQFPLFSDKSYASYPRIQTSHLENILSKTQQFFYIYVSIFIEEKIRTHTMDFSKDKHLQNTISEFIDYYGISGLEQALELYTDMQQEYICKTKTSVSKVMICDIYYLEIREHTIDIHTEHGTYQKYGTLNNELKQLFPYGFTKCTQSCIVSLHKIRTVLGNEIILTNHERLYMSRHYAPSVLMAFSSNHK